MINALQDVCYGRTSSPTENLHKYTSRFSLEETVTRLKKNITAEDLWLIHEINPQLLLQKEGLKMYGARQLLFFHPRYMKVLLGINPEALIEVPLKLVVMEMSDSTISVNYTDIRSKLSSYGDF
jgi:uncharacterized protein (DUF302 family)